MTISQARLRPLEGHDGNWTGGERAVKKHQLGVQDVRPETHLEEKAWRLGGIDNVVIVWCVWSDRGEMQMVWKSGLILEMKRRLKISLEDRRRWKPSVLLLPSDQGRNQIYVWKWGRTGDWQQLNSPEMLGRTQAQLRDQSDSAIAYQSKPHRLKWADSYIVSRMRAVRTSESVVSCYNEFGMLLIILRKCKGQQSKKS